MNIIRFWALIIASISMTLLIASCQLPIDVHRCDNRIELLKLRYNRDKSKILRDEKLLDKYRDEAQAIEETWYYKWTSENSARRVLEGLIKEMNTIKEAHVQKQNSSNSSRSNSGQSGRGSSGRIQQQNTAPQPSEPEPKVYRIII